MSDRLGLGFLHFGAFDPAGTTAPDPQRSLHEFLTLVEDAERLGLRSAWIRQRHLEPYFSSPIALLSAAAARTERIELGTGIVQIRYEHPIRLAEELSTADLISRGRLQIGVGTGIPPTQDVLDAAFGTHPLNGQATLNPDHRPTGASDAGSAADQDPGADRLAAFRAAVSGSVLAHGDGAYYPEGSPLTATPPNPGLATRLWKGPGRRRTAEQAGREGYHLLLSTLNSEYEPCTFAQVQRAQIDLHRDAWHAAGHPGTPRTAVCRLVFPTTDPELHRQYAHAADAFHGGVLRAVREDPSPRMHAADILVGSPDEIAEQLQADEAVQVADDLILTLPPAFPLDHARRVIATAQETVLPLL